MHISPKVLQKFILSSVFIFAIAPTFPTAAQITPDSTLGAERSRLDTNVLINNVLGERINGGAIRDRNLFHSFSEFNINDWQRVYFSNPSRVLNILTRVTGGVRSNIFGTLGVDGAANLFLINPNGILFGKNASLDVRGSFVGTTANGLQFGNQGIFSATNPQAPALLTVNPSALVFSQFQANAGITNLSQAPAGINPAGFDALGLRVPDGKSLLVVGGNVSMDGGELNAYGGRVELGGLAAPGNINLVVDGDNLRLGFPENGTRADVSLTNQANVYVTGVGGGNLVINAGNIDILNGSILSAGIIAGRGTPETVAGDIKLNATAGITVADGSIIRNLVRSNSQGQGGNITIDAGSFQLRDGAQLLASTYGRGNAGNVKVTATETISLKYPESYIFSTVEAGGVGEGGNIDINAASLSLSGGAQIGTFTRGQGDAGFIKINVSDLVSLDGSNGIFGSGVFNSVEDSGIGKGGDINIQTKMLSVTNAAAIVASARGKGDAGNIQINASDSINISGNNLDSGYSSGIFAFTLPKSTGQGGNIEINTSNLRLSEGGILDVRTRNERQGGSILINADTVQLLNGGGILSTTSGSGSAGKINVNAREKLIIDGFDRTFKDRIIKVGEEPLFNYFISTDSASSILVRSTSSGISGDIEVNSPRITLDSQGQLNAESASGNGGNINVNSNVLLLRRGSQISTTAGTAQSGGDGGNINLNTKFIVAVPGENSDITANAFTGKGGNINIQTQGIFGIELRPKPTDKSDITASSQLGIQGEIAISNPEIDPTKGIIELPNDVVDATTQLSQLCPTGYDALRKPLSEFIITGRDALPLSPLEPLQGTARIPLATLDDGKEERQENKSFPTSHSQPPTPQIIEAQGWVKTSDGGIALVAQVPKATPSSQPKLSPCPQPK